MPQSSNPGLIFFLCILLILFVVIATTFTAAPVILSFICRLNRETNYGWLNDVSELSSDKLKCLLLATNTKLSPGLVITKTCELWESISRSLSTSQTLSLTVTELKHETACVVERCCQSLISSHLHCFFPHLNQQTEHSSKCTFLLPRF